MPRPLDLVGVGVLINREWLTHRNRHGRKRLWYLRAIPAVDAPEAIGLEMERKDGMAGCLREPHRAGLRHTRRAARTVDREARGFPGRQITLQLQQGFASTA